MKILLQVALVFGIYWVGQGIEAVLPFAFPASVISLLLLLVLLLSLDILHIQFDIYLFLLILHVYMVVMALNLFGLIFH